MIAAGTPTIDDMVFGARQRLARQIAIAAENAQFDLVGAFRIARARLNLPHLIVGNAPWFRLPEFMRCPECGGRLGAKLCDVDPDTGIPRRAGQCTFCIHDMAERSLARITDTAPTSAHDYLPVVWRFTWWLTDEWIFHNVRVAP
ncbi:hypothetical protein [Pseudacidovorax intermedius]|uniref:hypothetical protein n=1 Tax=Pseudacidovorax intermedius TaxID=433924 RepID=UPI0026EE4955|nr:hypothetical protein [Pseudacidovorax intermedius]